MSLVDLAVQLSKVVHDAQDEHGLKTRHDIGLVLLAWLRDSPGDILALLREWGAKEAAVNPWANASYGGYLEVPEREGAYIIVPLDVLAADTDERKTHD